MSLGERISTILRECNVTQAKFARTLGITANYVHLLASGRKNSMSTHLAKLIEKTYGYSTRWILEGRGHKTVAGRISPSKTELLKRIRKMSEHEIKATLAFVKTLESVQLAFPDKPSSAPNTP